MNANNNILTQDILKRMARLVKMRAKKFDTPLIYCENGNVISYDVRKDKKKVLYAAAKI